MSSPHSRICGTTTSGMNCTAWNSVVANADISRPRAVPSTASTTANRPIAHGIWTSSPSSQIATAELTSDCTRAATPKPSAYPPMSSPRRRGVVSRRSSVPDVRSRTIVTDVTRNMMMNGNSPSICGPIRSNTTGVPS